MVRGRPSQPHSNHDMVILGTAPSSMAGEQSPTLGALDAEQHLSRDVA